MRTVAWLKAELSKFRDDAVCFAYEGEVRGIVIEPPLGANGRRDILRQGCIYCSEDDEYDVAHETDLLPPE
jgi:hypothetical protein